MQHWIASACHGLVLAERGEALLDLGTLYDKHGSHETIPPALRHGSTCCFAGASRRRSAMLQGNAYGLVHSTVLHMQVITHTVVSRRIGGRRQAGRVRATSTLTTLMVAEKVTDIKAPAAFAGAHGRRAVRCDAAAGRAASMAAITGAISGRVRHAALARGVQWTGCADWWRGALTLRALS